jgi:hypothetical protein
MTRHRVLPHLVRAAAGILTVALVASLSAGRGGGQPADPESLDVSPSSGPWLTPVSIEGSGCLGPPGADLVVLGRLYPVGSSEVDVVGQFKAIPADDGSWSASFVVTHRALGGGLVTPGAYSFRAECGIATMDEVGNTVPAQPPLVTSTGPFEVLGGGPVPQLEATPIVVPIVDGKADVTASGDLCARPDGPSSGEVALWGPIGADPDDPTSTYVAAGDFTPAPDGTWSLPLEPVMTAAGLSMPKPGTYSLTAICWLGTEGFETPNGFEYEAITITLVEAASTTTRVDAAPRFTG